MIEIPPEEAVRPIPLPKTPEKPVELIENPM